MRRVAVALTLLSLAPPLASPPGAWAQRIEDRDLFAKSLEVARQATEAFGAWDSLEQLSRVNELGYRVARHAGFEKLPLSFYLIDMPAPNAFALPGGQIFVTRGMIELGLSDDMLAALLGHEIAHVALDHHARMNRKVAWTTILSQALAVGVMVAAAKDRPPSDDVLYRRNRTNPYDPTVQEPTQGQVVSGAAAASIVLGEVMLRGFSRDHEDEADEEGQRWASAAGFSPTGTRELMALMSARMPQVKEYGYLQTHPFLDDRARAASSRAELLKAQTPRDPTAYRQATQEALLAFAKSANEKDVKPGALELLKQAALNAWPRGDAAGALRLERLHTARDAERAKLSQARNYGQLLTGYRAELAAVQRLDPESPLLATLRAEEQELEAERQSLYAAARKTFEAGVYETAFLEVFASNWPEAPEFPRISLALGDGFARRQQPTEAVTHYLAAWRAAPESDAGKRSREGLRNLTPVLEELAALQTLADADQDGELRATAAARLAAQAGAFTELRNGAEYLKRFPEGPHRAVVTERVNTLALKLYNEVVLYQALGEGLQALDRIQQILTYAPLSPAAERLREQAVLAS